MTAVIIQRLQDEIERASAQLVGRRDLVDLVYLALVAREHLLLVGPPGTAKSAAVRRAAEGVGGRYFEYLIGRFTEPAELFGPLDLEALRQGRLRPDISGLLPEAELAFLDEIFLGSTAILNALLTVLNERRYRRGHFDVAVPLRCCVAASNALPDDHALQAFADRFLLTAFVEPVGDNALEDLLARGWDSAQAELATRTTGNIARDSALTVADLDTLATAAAAVDLTAQRAAYAHLVRKLRTRGVPLSDRRIVKGQKLLAAAALLAGRTVATAADLWPVIYLVQDKTLQDEVRDLLKTELGESASAVLAAAAKTASFGPQARAQDLLAYGAALLDEAPGRDAPGFEAWLVRAESFLTQLDAGFAADKRPDDLTVLRARFIERSGAAQAAGATA